MPKAILKNLDSGQLDMMWSMLKIGGLKSCKHDVQALIDSTDFIRQALIQKTGGQRSDDPNGYIDFDDLQTHINILVCACLSLRASGGLEKITEITAPPKSNADRIRQMTDEELAKFMCLVKDKLCFGCAYSHVVECEGIPCEEGRKQWLRMDATNTNVGGKGGAGNG